MKNYTSKQIGEDFKYLKKQLAEIHSNPFINISKEELNNKYYISSINQEML